MDGTIAVIAISSSGRGSTANVNIRVSGLEEKKPVAVQAFVSHNTRNCQRTEATVSADGIVLGSVAAMSITAFLILPG